MLEKVEELIRTYTPHKIITSPNCWDMAGRKECVDNEGESESVDEWMECISSEFEPQHQPQLTPQQGEQQQVVVETGQPKAALKRRSPGKGTKGPAHPAQSWGKAPRPVPLRRQLPSLFVLHNYITGIYFCYTASQLYTHIDTSCTSPTFVNKSIACCQSNFHPSINKSTDLDTVDTPLSCGLLILISPAAQSGSSVSCSELRQTNQHPSRSLDHPSISAARR